MTFQQMDIEKELKNLKKRCLENFKNEVLYTVNVYNNSRKNGGYITKDHFLKTLQKHKEYYKKLIA